MCKLNIKNISISLLRYAALEGKLAPIIFKLSWKALCFILCTFSQGYISFPHFTRQISGALKVFWVRYGKDTIPYKNLQNNIESIALGEMEHGCQVSCY